LEPLLPAASSFGSMRIEAAFASRILEEKEVE
jgi:hypothetical protein